MDIREEMASTEHSLNDRQAMQYKLSEALVETYGMYNQSHDSDGAHYMPVSPFSADGMVCSNCVAYEGPRACHLVEGDIDPNGLCKLWVIPGDLMVGAEMYSDEETQVRGVPVSIGYRALSLRQDRKPAGSSGGGQFAGKTGGAGAGGAVGGYSGAGDALEAGGMPPSLASAITKGNHVSDSPPDPLSRHPKYNKLVAKTLTPEEVKTSFKEGFDRGASGTMLDSDIAGVNAPAVVASASADKSGYFAGVSPATGHAPMKADIAAAGALAGARSRIAKGDTSFKTLTKKDAGHPGNKLYESIQASKTQPGRSLPADEVAGAYTAVEVEERLVAGRTFEMRATPTAITATADSDDMPMTFRGYAALFNSPSQPLPFIETIKPGAFKRSLNSGKEIRMYLNHDSNKILASTRSGTLRLTEDSRGLMVEADIPPTTYGKDVSILMQRGDVHSMSFGFTVPNAGDSWSGDGRSRELREVILHEVSVVTGFPAYQATEGQATINP